VVQRSHVCGAAKQWAEEVQRSWPEKYGEKYGYGDWAASCQVGSAKLNSR
jgi:hypothetical protein